MLRECFLLKGRHDCIGESKNRTVSDANGIAESGVLECRVGDESPDCLLEKVQRPE